MHVRRTDKHTEDYRAANSGLREYAQLLKVHARWHAAERPSHHALRVLVGSEDPNTYTQLPPMLSPNRAYWIAPRLFAMNMSGRYQYKDGSQNSARLAELYTANASTASERDEAATLLAQMLLMSACRTLIASFSSNIAIIIRDLMYSGTHERGALVRAVEEQGSTSASAIALIAERVAPAPALPPPHAYDVDGRAYCGCGGSLCMELEQRSVPVAHERSIRDG